MIHQASQTTIDETSIVPKETIEAEPLIEQTQFSIEKPLFEDQSVLARQGIAVDDLVGADQPKRGARLRWALMGLGALLVLFILLVLWMWSQQSPTTVPPDAPSVTSPIVSQDGDVWADRWLMIDQQLQAADPARQNLPFPQVNLDLRLE